MSRIAQGRKLVESGALTLEAFNHIVGIKPLKKIPQPKNIKQLLELPLGCHNIKIKGYISNIEQWQYFQKKDISLQRFSLSDNTGTITAFVWKLKMPLDLDIGDIINIKKCYKREKKEISVNLEDIKKRKVE